MAKKKYIAIINDPVTDMQVETFSKALASLYVNIKGGEYIFLLLVNDENEVSKSIYNKVAAKINNEFSFIIVEFKSWYGNLLGNTFDWLKENFPEDNIEIGKSPAAKST